MSLFPRISIEEGESVFSFIFRLSRIADLLPEELLGSAASFDLTGMRDFPIGLRKIEQLYGFHPGRLLHFAHKNSAAPYFASTIPDELREKEVYQSSLKPSDLIRHSIGTRRLTVRFCEACALHEYQGRRFSWWHRDHQLPLSLFCLRHRRSLRTVELVRLKTSLPHEQLSKGGPCADKPFDPISIGICETEREIANGFPPNILQASINSIKNRLSRDFRDTYDQLDYVSSRLYAKQGNTSVISGLDMNVEKYMVENEIYRLLKEGTEYADPVLAIALVSMFSSPTDRPVSDSQH